MIGFFSQLISMSVQAAPIILLVVLSRFILIKCGVPKKFIMILWIIPFFFLVCPWKISVPYSMPGNGVSGYSAEDIAELFSEGQSNSGAQQMGDAPIIIIGASGGETTDLTGISDGDGSVSTSQSLTAGGNNGVEDSVRGLSGIEIIAIIWGIGIMAITAYSTYAYIGLKKQLVCRLEFKENIYFADDIATPLVLGVVKPCIYIPSDISDEYLEYVINHEKTHIRRCDHVVKLIFFIITALHWFNPFVWAAYMLMCSDMEMACDEMTIQAMGMDRRAEYANALLQISSGNGKHKKRMLGAPLAFSEGDTGNRIKNALKYKQIAGIAVVAVVIIGIGITVLFLTESVAKADVGNDIAETENTDEEIESITAYSSSENEEETASSAEESAFGKLDIEQWESGEISVEQTLTMDKVVDAVNSGSLHLMDYYYYNNAVWSMNAGEYNYSATFDLTYQNEVYELVVSYVQKTKEMDSIQLIRTSTGQMTYLYMCWTEQVDYSKELEEFLSGKSIELHTFMGLELPEGYYFSEYFELYGISGGELILPMAYEVYGDGEQFTPEYWRSAGSIGRVSTFFFTFENGKLGTNIPYGNHQEEEFVEFIDTEGAWQALLAHYNFDLYTAAQYEELEVQGIVAEETASEYWYVFFVNENEDEAYYISLAAKLFSKEDAIAMAMQVLRD